MAMKIHGMIISRPGFRIMFRQVDTVYEDEFKRILRCSNRIGYQLWIDMNCIDKIRYNEVKRWWLPNLQMWDV